jgi:tRNA1Val (adenine37-N6)-methyltransferase
MVAQRCNSLVDAIDIDLNAVLQATDNVALSPWADRIKVKEVSLQDYAGITLQRYDLIVSNPPYFINSLKTTSENRTVARHADSLTHKELISHAIRLLKPEGRICIILPIVESLLCKEYAINSGLFCTREVKVIPKPSAIPKRTLMEFKLQAFEPEISEIVIESNERHHYSEEFSLLAKEFYLKL